MNGGSANKNPDENYLNKYLEQKALVLREELALAELAVGEKNSIKGILLEAVFRKALRAFLPKTIEVGTGLVVDLAQQYASRQCDIIIYTALNTPPIYQYGDFVVIDYRMAYAVLEVKSTLNSNAIRDASMNMNNLSNVLSPEARWFLVAAKASVSADTVGEHAATLLRGCSGGVLVLKDSKSGKPYYIEGTTVHWDGPFPKFLKSVFDSTSLAKPRGHWL